MTDPYRFGLFERILLFAVFFVLIQLVVTNTIWTMRLVGDTPPEVYGYFRLGGLVAVLLVFFALLGRPMVSIAWTVTDRFIKTLGTRQ